MGVQPLTANVEADNIIWRVKPYLEKRVASGDEKAEVLLDKIEYLSREAHS